MEQEDLDYHLELAQKHLSLAFQKSQTLIQSKETDKEILDKWNRFMLFMFGKSWT